MKRTGHDGIDVNLFLKINNIPSQKGGVTCTPYSTCAYYIILYRLQVSLQAKARSAVSAEVITCSTQNLVIHTTCTGRKFVAVEKPALPTHHFDSQAVHALMLIAFILRSRCMVYSGSIFKKFLLIRVNFAFLYRDKHHKRVAALLENIPCESTNDNCFKGRTFDVQWQVLSD